MGAARVEAVANQRDVSRSLDTFDYVVVKEPHDVEQYAQQGATCVHFKWVKDCLFASRLLPTDFDYTG